MSYDHTSATAKSDQPKANSDLREIPAQLHLMSAAIENPAATPLGSSIQFARLRVEQIATRIIDIRTRIGL